jgi:hypothetical protein
MDPRSPLVAWETFFFLVGSSAAGLTGLQFVVIALIAESKRRATNREIDAFTTPTIVHFGGVLLVSAVISAPWNGLSRVALVLGAIGGVGLVYTLVVTKRARNQLTYQMVWEDWLWHVILPLIAYALLVISAVFLRSHAHRALFVVGATAMLFLFIGIHNAWDTVTYITTAFPREGVETEATAGREDRLEDSSSAGVNAESRTQHSDSRQKSKRKFRGRK